VADWRVRQRQTRCHFDRLGEHSWPTILIECRECCFRREFQTLDLLAIYGPEYRMTYLRYDVANCPAGKRFKQCAVRYVSM
jgi:hypothetical protein